MEVSKETVQASFELNRIAEELVGIKHALFQLVGMLHQEKETSQERPLEEPPLPEPHEPGPANLPESEPVELPETQPESLPDIEPIKKPEPIPGDSTSQLNLNVKRA
ncbi:hypothetical protein [Legionella jamestowniensis]|uniref:Coiled-coil protein n=1 Tax=Legionella jamestowniensis TaxID=455 RepID=A0A0W0UIT2_9GAMM|nr:hypothetical protein [Legionella jamestowniensis]KTD07558.1 hypothetical protein Ljam_1753 [Legionella jamestowniensis]OCH97674.1 hypothetical protein A8135_02215 [Legionella jamestowniensis]SFM01736.1 hypothetical protein SAMN02746073_3083 [Legionella jamestowniensis DSM 19215]